MGALANNRTNSGWQFYGVK